MTNTSKSNLTQANARRRTRTTKAARNVDGPSPAKPPLSSMAEGLSLETEGRARAVDAYSIPAMPIAEVAAALGLPRSTLEKLRWRGSGPKCFRIGRRLFVRNV